MPPQESRVTLIEIKNMNLLQAGVEDFCMEMYVSQRDINGLWPSLDLAG